MNNSTVKSVVIVGLLFLAGLVVLSFVNFINFSPATAGVRATSAAATSEPTDTIAAISINALNVCDNTKCDVTISIENGWKKKVTAGNVIISGADGTNKWYCGDGVVWGGTVTIDPGKKVLWTCYGKSKAQAARICLDIYRNINPSNGTFGTTCKDIK